MENKYELLNRKEIIEILDGDIELGKYNGNILKMPYLSAPKICEISVTFGFPQKYSFNNKEIKNLSRWEYMNKLIDYCIKNNKIKLLLSYLCKIDRFSQILDEKTIQETEESYKKIISLFIAKINSILFFGGNKLENIDNQFIITGIKNNVKVEIPNIKVIDIDYIRELSSKAFKDIEEGDIDSSVTKSRTIIEETFCYAIEKKGITPDSSGQINKLYKQIKDLYNMHADANMDQRIKKLLSGLETILSAISEMRNNGSDSHGLGSKRINILPYHARLCVNSAVIMSEFILSVCKNNENKI